ncbi:hypothetical protein Tco_0494415 [Tanacetum coccineum]
MSLASVTWYDECRSPKDWHVLDLDEVQPLSVLQQEISNDRFPFDNGPSVYCTFHYNSLHYTFSQTINWTTLCMPRDTRVHGSSISIGGCVSVNRLYWISFLTY